MSTTTSTEVMSETHPLNNKWIMWYDYQEKRYISTDSWCDNLKTVASVGSAEMLWAVCEDIGDVQELPLSSNLHFFREGIQPMWEDPKNAAGGKWVLEVCSGQFLEACFWQKIKELWQGTLLFCVSEMVLLKSTQDYDKPIGGDPEKVKNQVDTSLEGVVCGAVFSPRKNCVRFSVWTNTRDERVVHVGSLWKKIAGIPDSLTITFKAHESAIKGARDGAQDIYTV